MTAQSKFGKHLWILAPLLLATLELLSAPRPLKHAALLFHNKLSSNKLFRAEK